MLAECVNCGLYVASDEKFCPDCGLLAPNAPLKFKSDDFERPLIFKFTAAMAAIIVIGVIVYRVREDSYNFRDLFGLLALVVLISLAFSVFAASFVTHRAAKNERRQRFIFAEAATNFRFIQATILLRNHELNERLGDFRSSSKRGIRLSAGAKKPQTSPEKIEILNLVARYNLLNNKIDFARAQNKLLPFLEPQNASQNKESSTEKLDEIRSELEFMKLALTDEYSGRTSENLQNEKRDLLVQVDETENLCEALTKRRSNVHPFEDDSEKLSSDDLARRIKNLDVQTMLVNFANSFTESEREYERWKINRR